MEIQTSAARLDGGYDVVSVPYCWMHKPMSYSRVTRCHQPGCSDVAEDEKVTVEEPMVSYCENHRKGSG